MACVNRFSHVTWTSSGIAENWSGQNPQQRLTDLNWAANFHNILATFLLIDLIQFRHFSNSNSIISLNVFANILNISIEMMTFVVFFSFIHSSSLLRITWMPTWEQRKTKNYGCRTRHRAYSTTHKHKSDSIGYFCVLWIQKKSVWVILIKNIIVANKPAVQNRILRSNTKLNSENQYTDWN